MFRGQKEAPTQLNLGSLILAPMHDLIFTIRQPASIRLLLAMCSEEELKKGALENEIFFAARFGFEANRPIREQIIQLQEDHQFSDKDIRRLYRSTWLSTRGNVVTLKPSRRSMQFAQVQLTVITLFCVLIVIAVGTSGAAPARQVLAQFMALFVWGVMTFPTYWYSLRPWRALRDAGVV